MSHRRESDEDSTVLSGPAATRLLERASELDAARLAEVRVAELRAAATEAGISTDAFNAALEEIQHPAPPVVAGIAAPSRSRKHRSVLLAVFTVFAALFTVYGVRRTIPAPIEPAFDETFLLHCLTSQEAAALIRPILGENGMLYSRTDAERILTVRAPHAQIELVRAELERLESPGSSACALGGKRFGR